MSTVQVVVMFFNTLFVRAAAMCYQNCVYDGQKERLRLWYLVTLKTDDIVLCAKNIDEPISIY